MEWWKIAVRRKLEKVRDVALHRLGFSNFLRAADGLHLSAPGDAGVAQTVPLLPQHRLVELHDLLPALEQSHHGDGGSRHASRKPQEDRPLDPGHYLLRWILRRLAPNRMAEPDP